MSGASSRQSQVTGKKSMGLCSDCVHAKHEQYREAGHLLREAMAVE